MSDVTAVVCTKNRYELLSQALLSIALQSVKPDACIIFDDSDQPPKDANDLVQKYPAYGEVFSLFQEYGIGWEWKYGQKQGQHHSHQASQKVTSTDLIWRVDDDEVPEPDVLYRLLKNVRDDVGAVGGLVLNPSPPPLPPEAASIITDLDRPNIQWFTQPARVVEVDHLHSTFLYRRGLVDYELSLSPAAHREETLFTYQIKRAGYKLLVDTSVVTWHFRSPTGGIRSHHDPGFWNHDENVFAQKMLDWGVVKPRPEKIIVLDAGRGDHVIIKKLLPQIKAKYPNVLIATCHPDILDGEVQQISIAEARRNLGNLENHSIYGFCTRNNWQGNLVEAFQKMYELE